MIPLPLPEGQAATGQAATGQATLGTVAQLAGYLVNGFWQSQGELAHHWASNALTYNLGNLTVSEQNLALSALNAWHQVANVTFSSVSSGAEITFNHNGTMTASTTVRRRASIRLTSFDPSATALAAGVPQMF